ncbi:MAG: NUDIX domain-containing protein [Ruminococcaceae bacterium]|nr:NUDIX domain-containing protein [Oscillospiraceae bacterium]
MMKHDCCFNKENNRFRYRTGAILIHDGKMLFVRSKFGGYYYMLGGGVHMGETSAACIEREFLEETGIEARAERLAVVCENFFLGVGGVIDGMDCHTLEFYYTMSLCGDVSRCRQFTDDGEELVWLPVEDIPDSDVKPAFIREIIHRILHDKETIHVIEERDRRSED